MDHSTPTAATGQKLIANLPDQDGFIVVVEESSAADLRIITGLAYEVDGELTEDPTGILLAAGGSITLEAGAYICRTAADGSAADFSAAAFKRKR
jgi:hypothetical protein